ncbi:uncharacterized protein TNCV_1023251 [Trichonephila clavipes]|nr:uncharacterized protein TNCV_1023251 [Trichonephila clavipes]
MPPPDGVRSRPTKFIAAKGWNLCLSLALALSTMQVTMCFFSVPPQFRGRKPWGWSGASHLSSPSINHTRGLAARRLFRVPPCRKGTIHLQTSMSSPGFEPSPYGIAVSVANHHTGWATDVLQKITNTNEHKPGG